ncbi:hypothetical protein V7O66_13930 [Methanolobus sp. ZRKC3]
MKFADDRPCTCGECHECLRIMRQEEMGVYNRSLDTPLQTHERERMEATA